MAVILAVDAGIGSSAGVFRDGEPVFCIQEERLTGIKNYMGIPRRSILYLLENGLLAVDEVDFIGVSDINFLGTTRESFYGGYEKTLTRARNLSLARRAGSKVSSYLRHAIRQNKPLYDRYKTWTRPRETDEDFLGSMGFPREKIERVEHHYCHAAAAYYGLADSLNEEYLVFTLDGGGDGLTSALWSARDGSIERIDDSSCYSIGNIYSAVTQFLGFRPHEHEYKLMGLAPYVREEYSRKVRAGFADFLDLEKEDCRFFNQEYIHHEVFLRSLFSRFAGERFDNIAAGLQAFTEDIVIRWVKGAIRRFKVGRILCAGGVFMNVKLNMLLSQLPEVEWIDVFPSCGDESNIFGSAFHLHNKHVEKRTKCLSRYTLGPTPSSDLQESLASYQGRVRFREVSAPNKLISDHLLEGRIVARCTGEMEFGARALGNRSILADPRHLNNVNRINRAVKLRDFWMPFAPAVLWEHGGTLLKIPGSIKPQGSPYMMFAFDTVEQRRDEFVCGVHQADFTARAQTITPERYPDFCEIIQHFYQATGVPSVLNTSFNLHGFPIVATSREAIEVLLQSDIDVLMIDNHEITKYTS